MKRIKIVSAAFITAILIICLLGIYRYFTEDSQRNDAQNFEGVLQNASELSTQRYDFTNVITSVKGEIPIISKNRYLVKYSTSVSAGFDVSEAVIEQSDEAINITIPHCRADESTIKISMDDIVLYDTNFAFIDSDENAILEIVAEAEADARRFVNSGENGFLDAADTNAVSLVEELFRNISGGRQVNVAFAA